MDAIFAILVLCAVIFFGALISAGNERQRKAIDGIREQAAQWAMQDLRLKREHLARDVKVEDPVAWLNRVVAKVVGEDLMLTVKDFSGDQKQISCITADGRLAILSLISLESKPKNTGYKAQKLISLQSTPLILLPKDNTVFELSILNAGILFDYELGAFWKAVSNRDILDCEKLFLYIEN